MKNKKIFESLGKIKNDDTSHDRILNGILDRVRSGKKKKGKVKSMSEKSYWKMLAPIAACLIIVLFVAFFAIPSRFAPNQIHVFASENLMEGIAKQSVEGKSIDDSFVNATQGFSIELLKQSISTKEKKDINTLISPMSVYLALGMTANGADNETLKQFEEVMGGSEISIEDLNRYYYSLQQKLKNSKSVELNIANSIWYRKEEGFLPNMDFLQTNANYYGADAYKKDFDLKTVKEINSWVKTNTDGLIEKMLDDIDSDTMMFLINTVLFDANWERPYTKDKVNKDIFNVNGNKTVSADFMSSEESFYLEDKTAQGFVKPYKNNEYSFMAILPNKEIDINEYVESLNAEKFASLLNSKTEGSVYTSIPKFKYSYENDFVTALHNMGIKNAFNENADFSKMSNEELFVSKVLHKTFIQVDEKGTKAGAATSVEMRREGMPIYDKTIKLDKPFVYAIIDNETNLPVFIGTVLDPTLG